MDATDVWGMTTFSTTDTILEEIGEQKASMPA